MIRTGCVIGLIVLAVLGTSLTLADSGSVPTLTGNWTGTSVGHENQSGYWDSQKYHLLLSISEQRERVFNGSLTFLSEGTEKDYTKGISGVIGPDMKTVYMAEYDKGIDMGQLTDPDTLEIIYLKDGKDAIAAIDTFTRVQ